MLLRSVIAAVVFYSITPSYAGSYDDFFLSLQKDNSAIVQALLERGFDPNTVSTNNVPSLHLALKEGALKVAQLLIAHPKTQIDARNTYDETPLMLAAVKGYVDICEELIRRDVDINKTGWTPLHYAASGGHLSIIELLLAHHAYIDSPSPNGSTPLMLAAKYAHINVVKHLLNAGADPRIKNDLGLTAIHFANDGGHAESADLIAESIRKLQPLGAW